MSMRGLKEELFGEFWIAAVLDVVELADEEEDYFSDEYEEVEF